MLFAHLILVICYLYIAIRLDRKVHKVERILEELLEELKSIDENEELKKQYKWLIQRYTSKPN